MRLNTQHHGPLTTEEKLAVDMTVKHMEIAGDDESLALAIAESMDDADGVDLKRIFLLLFERYVQ